MMRPEANAAQCMETGRNRLLVTGVMFMIAFAAIGVRLVDLAFFDRGGDLRTASHAKAATTVTSTRADIIDRNGVVLATSLPTASLYADPHDIMDATEAAQKLSEVLPSLNTAEIEMKLNSMGRFVWISRNLTPKQQYAVNRLGIPGLSFQYGEKRVYPHGPEAAHVLGLTDVDGNGIAGVEQYFAEVLSKGDEPLQLSIDIRIQSILRAELIKAVTEFSAIGAAGLVMDVETGEVVAMTSLPDYDPNSPASVSGSSGFNRATKGVYEMGSTFKLFTTAMALDSGTVGLSDGYDTTDPIRVARFTINDFHGKKRWLSVPEILTYSSNIGTAKMALDVGTEGQKFYLERLGLLQQASIELPEVGAPLSPSRWSDISTMTISYGHGIAVSSLQVVDAVSTLVNGGIRRPVTLLKQRSQIPIAGTRVLAADTSDRMRMLMRQVVTDGTGRNAGAPGYLVGGKTGTAEKLMNGGYHKEQVIASFVGTFPMDKPRYVVLAMVDEPKGIKRTFNYATGGWVAAPVVKNVITRMATLLGVVPRNDDVPGGHNAGKGGSALTAMRAGGRKVATY
ncbi:MAG: penicillin-binding protein 2 [Rhodospirillaceae bacterium]|nr:penicillin-binding protein 2 [Rhodospirillaceae bacterium]MBT5014190.1 penicillin-binding protein 2 [Rhodospirillaceae bacterium]MBT7355891.1 penicillin-binding protein 2 [Rhodospirillaceae bacterium]